MRWFTNCQAHLRFIQSKPIITNSERDIWWYLVRSIPVVWTKLLLLGQYAYFLLSLFLKNKPWVSTNQSYFTVKVDPLSDVSIAYPLAYRYRKQTTLRSYFSLLMQHCCYLLLFTFLSLMHSSIPPKVTNQGGGEEKPFFKILLNVFMLTNVVVWPW